MKRPKPDRSTNGYGVSVVGRALPAATQPYDRTSGSLPFGTERQRSAARPLHRVVSNVFVRGRWQDNPPPDDASLMIADPVYGNGDADALAKMASDIGLPAAIFMWPEELCSLTLKPDQVLHWVKPESTKNTAKKYSRFVEVIACYGLEFHGSLHWSNRTGLFTDRLFSNAEHPWKKPESLIERLIRNHWPGYGTVYDPCAGSRTVEAVCRRLGIGSLSVDVC